MALSRKKQDEKNIKTLRELGTLPQNKYCFDCNQRGPTYVNVTIGSFVCTKCSGMLRGLTPPHRVKSISMATFTTEEIELLKNRGNDYCKHVWLGLYDLKNLPTDNNRDDQAIRDFMVDKYERKRYYLDPAQASRNGLVKTSLTIPTSNDVTKFKPINKTLVVTDSKSIKLNGNSMDYNRKRPEVNNKNSNVVGNFINTDVFSSNNSNNNNINNNHNSTRVQQKQQLQQESFANFDNNPVFNNGNNETKYNEFSIFDLKFTNSGPVLNQVPLFPKCNTNRWSSPIPSVFNNMSLQSNIVKGSLAPSEDRYAALKDLDNALKSQSSNGIDWNSSSCSNGSSYNSPTPTSSMYSSPSPQNSVFGSPNQGQFLNTFQANLDNNTFSNPFNNNGLKNWSNGNNNVNVNGSGNIQQSFANPFRDSVKINGFNQGFQPAVFPTPNNGSTWAPNPFKVGASSNTNSNNPFL